MNRNRQISALFVFLGAGLLAWILVDASSVDSTLGLSAVLDEASVAVLGLAVSGACFVAAFRVSRRPALAANAA